MTHLLNARLAVFLFISLLTLAVVACSSNVEDTRPANANTPANVSITANTNTTANTTSATANQPGGIPATPKLNLNTTSKNDFLSAIPNLGNRMVHEFEEYRPYRSIQQFRREIGKYVSPAQVAEYEKYVYVPIAENESDAATLGQIPGLDTTEAEALIAARPYASRDAFLTKLSEKVSADELTVAKTYLSNQ